MDVVEVKFTTLMISEVDEVDFQSILLRSAKLAFRLRLNKLDCRLHLLAPRN